MVLFPLVFAISGIALSIGLYGLTSAINRVGDKLNNIERAIYETREKKATK